MDPVIDISHWSGNALNFGAAAGAGVQAIVHKATQGNAGVDPMWAVNRPKILAANLKFGSYHFGNGSDGGSQAQFFLSTVGPNPGELLALDLESNPAGPSMGLEEARAFVTTIFNAVGKWPVLYAGHSFKDMLNGSADAVLGNCPLWLAQYGPTAVLPPGWTAWSLWQYTDGAYGAPPAVPGIGHCDREKFNTAAGALADFWASVSL